jgi:hypothetical protein
MVEECVHVNEKGHKCRRIPKRGQKLCPAHRARRRQRGALEENPAFFQEMDVFMNRLKAMNLEDLLYATTGALGDIHALIDRRSSRRDRAAYMRATVAVGEATDRIFLTLVRLPRRARTKIRNHTPRNRHRNHNLRNHKIRNHQTRHRNPRSTRETVRSYRPPPCPAPCLSSPLKNSRPPAPSC